MNIAQVCLDWAQLKAILKCAVLLYGRERSEHQSVSGLSTICLTSLLHRDDQVVDGGLWNVGPLLFNGCAKLLDIGRNWNALTYTPIQSIVSRLTMKEWDGMLLASWNCLQIPATWGCVLSCCSIMVMVVDESHYNVTTSGSRHGLSVHSVCHRRVGCP